MVKMTSEVDALKTNEFLRRRKLRIQQVREQSKDIAKKIRQRASSEKLKHLINLDETKEKEYLKHQDNLIKKLEQLHAKSLAHLGTSHKNAAEATQKENKPEPIDVSQKRARIAAEELRRQKQEKLDERKKLLDRKLIARNVANEISREKSSSVAIKLSKATIKSTEEVNQATQTEVIPEETTPEQPNDNKDEEIATNDMATQWGYDSLPNEWEPNIPRLPLSKNDSPKESTSTGNQSEKKKRPNLFALSEEMPASLCGGVSRVSENTSSVKPSFTLVSDYIQNRDLRLREFDVKSSKPATEDLQRLKNTIFRTRASRVEGNISAPVHVADCHVIPVPSWKPENNNSGISSHKVDLDQSIVESRQFNTITNSEINKLFKSIRPKPDLQPTPVLRGSTPFKRNKLWPPSCSGSANPKKCEKAAKIDSSDQLNKKSSVTMYNHSTRDVRDVPYADGKLVSRDQHIDDEDAYSQAMKETSSEQIGRDKDLQKKLQDTRNKIAMSKQSVEKEYKHTMNFLKSLSKEKTTPIKNAYKDAQQEKLWTEQRQNKLQHEFRKIERECRKQAHPNMKPTRGTKFANMNNNLDNEDSVDAKDFQYSWMPVPERDKGLAVHIIPTKIKEQKNGNTVKFSKIDSYHEYRSRHEHTPPTKDTSEKERSKVIDRDYIEEPNEETSNSSECTSSVEDFRLVNNKKSKSCYNDTHVEAERILIYKILNTRSDKRVKVKKKHSKDCAANSKNFVNEESHSNNGPETSEKVNDVVQQYSSDNTPSVGKNMVLTPNSQLQLQEGIYKTVSKNGDNICSVHLTADEKTKKGSSGGETSNINRSSDHFAEPRCDISEKTDKQPTQVAQPSSVSSFKTATNDRGSQNVHTKIDEANGLLPGGFVKVVDQSGQESGKFFIGATGLLKDDAYEVIIKLRKTDTNKPDNEDTTSNTKERQIPKYDMSQSQPLNAKSEEVQDIPSVNVCEKEIIGHDLNTDIPTKALPKQNSIVDKGIDAPVQDAFTSPEKTTVKPLTSVSVQTSSDTPDRRNHMSSSTSTAYMSPPEVILPKYLKRKYYESPNSIRSWNQDVYMLRKSRPHSKLNTSKSKPKLSPLVKIRPKNKKIETPPNTARSFGDYDRTLSYNSKNPPSFVMLPRTAKKRKSAKGLLKTNLQITNHISSKNLLAPPPSLNNLNPTVKRYIDKLLHLNKEGVTAMEVVNQDCSSVITPGSSVVDDTHNVDKLKAELEPKISLEQLKQMIIQQIWSKYEKDIIEEYEIIKKARDADLKEKSVRKIPFSIPKKRSVHKVKSLNISRSLFLKKIPTKQHPVSNMQSSCSASKISSRNNYDILTSVIHSRQKHRSKSSPSPRRPNYINSRIQHKTNSFEGISDNNSANYYNTTKKHDIVPFAPVKANNNSNTEAAQGQEDLILSWKCDDLPRKRAPSSSLHSSTQTTCNIDEQLTYVKRAEDKLQNMEKIADLTEKCTQRLSNLAKVLEEVRKNKLSYSQASESASDTDQVSGKNSDTVLSTLYEPIIEIKHKEILSSPSPQSVGSPSIKSPVSPPAKLSKDFESKDNVVTGKIKQSPPLKKPKSPIKTKISNIRTPKKAIAEQHSIMKNRVKPPTALRCFKRAQEYVVPHELSTVVEVDSPISIKFKNRSTKDEDLIDCDEKQKNNGKSPVSNKIIGDNHGLLENNVTKQTHFNIPDNSAEDTKLQMMDLKQFNDIMLRPFISIQEYAKQCNVTKLEEGSNLDTLLRGDVIADELSSLHSDGSLPDIIAELLKRDVISEPFKFETTSNMNSAVSSDSTLSVLALSKTKRGKNKTNELNQGKMEETSDTLSGSSNPDLENTFKKLGMGWASSTLKKTKEHLALSSSTNTSSSSISQFKLKTVQSKDSPVLVTESMSSIRNVTTMTGLNAPSGSVKLVNEDSRKTAGQQTSLSNSMTVNEFLKNELAKRITFGDKSRTKDTQEEFISLCETKMPEDMQRTPKREERSIDSNPRARTSTPVQLFKSMTYHSSSSSYNGLFSNADDLSSVKGTSNSMRNHSTSEKDDLTIPNFSLRTKKNLSSDCSRSDD